MLADSLSMHRQSIDLSIREVVLVEIGDLLEEPQALLCALSASSSEVGGIQKLTIV